MHIINTCKQGIPASLPGDSEVDFAKFYMVVQHLGEPFPLYRFRDERGHDLEMQPDHRLIVHESHDLVA